MTDIKFDSATGLPTLPEGQYWEVVPAETYGGNWAIPDEKHYLLMLMKIIPARVEPKVVRVKQHWHVQWFYDIIGDKYETVEVDVPETDSIVENGHIVVPEGDDLSAKYIVETALKILDKIKKRAEIDALLGKYPPNTLATDFGD